MSEARHSKIEGVRPPAWGERCRRLALKQSCASIEVLLRRLSRRFVLLESHVPLPCACPPETRTRTRFWLLVGHAVALRCVCLARQALDEGLLAKEPRQDKRSPCLYV